MVPSKKNYSHVIGLRIAFSREKRGIEEFYDEEFLTRKTGEKNEKLTGLKKDLFWKKYRKI